MIYENLKRRSANEQKKSGATLRYSRVSSHCFYIISLFWCQHPTEEELSISAKMKIMPKKSNSVLIVSLLVLAGIGGYSLGASQSVPKTSPSLTQNLIKASSLFQAQTATLQGKVIKVTQDLVTVSNSRGQEDFPLSKKFLVYKPIKEGSPQATASSDIRLIDYNKTVLIMLEFLGGQYQVVSISDLPK